MMKSIPSQLPDGQQLPNQTHSIGNMFIGWALLYAVFFVILLAISYPILVVGTLGLATTIALGIRVQRRRRDHRSRRRCVPVVGVCVEL